MKMVGDEFLDRLNFYQSSWLPARAVVEEAVKQRHQVQDCPIQYLNFYFYIFYIFWFLLLFFSLALRKDISEAVKSDYLSFVMAGSCRLIFKDRLQAMILRVRNSSAAVFPPSFNLFSLV